LDQGLPAGAVAAVEPHAAAFADFAARGVPRYGSVGELPQDFAPKIVVLAVKPQTMAEATGDLRQMGAGGCVFLSVAAGKTIASLESLLGDAAVVRAMPNTPALVGRGTAVLVANARVDQRQRADCEALLAAVGTTAWVESDGLIDAVTAVSGSGPAYVFYLIECMAQAGVAAGLPEDLAMKIARSTVAGAGELVRQSPKEAGQLRRNVTSPGGTTQAALDVLMADDGLAPLMEKAIAAAAQRSRELD
jgi:pyrroline-5-carboxylate reductase